MYSIILKLYIDTDVHCVFTLGPNEMCFAVKSFHIRQCVVQIMVKRVYCENG